MPVAAGAVAITLFAAHESKDETVDPKVDIPGIAAITLGLTSLVLALTVVLTGLASAEAWHPRPATAAPSSSPPRLTVTQGVIFVICVLAFRRGIVGEIAAKLRVSL